MGDWALNNTDLPQYLEQLFVPVMDAESLVRLFDKSGDSVVDHQELVDGIVCMNDDIMPKDYIKLGLWTWNLLMRAKKLEEKLNGLQAEVHEVCTFLEGAFG